MSSRLLPKEIEDDGRPHMPTIYNPFTLGKDRRLDNRKPKPVLKVRPEHRQLIALHMSGMSTQAIAEALGRPYSWVSSILSDPTIKGILEKINEVVDMELAAMFPLALKAVRESLQSGNETVKLNAAGMILKSQGKLGDAAVAKADTAEDVMQRLLVRIKSDGPTDITIGQEIKNGNGSDSTS